MRKLPKILNSEEYSLLLRTIDKKKFERIPRKKLQQYKIAIILAAESGLRISEIIGLHKLKSKCCKENVFEKKEGKKKHKFCVKCEKKLSLNDFYRDSNEWQIKPLSKENINNGRIEIRNAKGGKDRIVGLPSKITDKYIKLLPLKIKRRALQKFVTSLGKKVLNKHITFHTLRHSFATEFQRRTGDIRTLQALLGHSSIATTQIYAHVSPDDAIQKQKEVFG